MAEKPRRDDRKDKRNFPEMSGNIYNVSPEIVEVVLGYKSNEIITGSNVGLFGFFLDRKNRTPSNQYFLYFGNRIITDKDCRTISTLCELQKFDANKILSKGVKKEDLMRLPIDTRYIPPEIDRVVVVTVATQQYKDDPTNFKILEGVTAEVRIGDEDSMRLYNTDDDDDDTEKRPIDKDKILASYKFSTDAMYATAIVTVLLRRYDKDDSWLISYPGHELEGDLESICKRYGLVVM